jgi:glycogen debranching enzyme
VVEAHPLNGGTPATSAQLGAQLLALNDAIPALYAGTTKFWNEFLSTHLSVSTPDKKFDDAIQWAEVSIEQAQVRYKPAGAKAETGLTAGFFSSGDSARPGFGWFFGRDTLWTMYAIDSFGDFDLARRAMDFVMARQRADGKVMHEYSQTADEVDWKAFPYEYAAADATPLLIMAMEDYVDASGDTAYLKRNWLHIQKAWEFETTHDADGDGIYDNAQGTGWVESWPQGMPKQEIYLAVLDEQASGAMGRLAELIGDASLGQSAAARGTKIAATIEREYAPAASGDMWAFSWNGGTGQDTTATIYPAVAWWDGRAKLPNSDGMFRRWASPEFSTDWGTRDVGDHEKVYDPISYHQGTVWPLFTGWAAMAEYRTGRPLAGYQHLMENVDLTYAQDLGAVTELLSGEFYAPLGRSSSHQTWSSAMVLTPAMRGLFGIRVDAAHKTVWVDPQLPAGWTAVRVRNLNLGGSLAALEITPAPQCSNDCGGGAVGLTGAPGWKVEGTYIKSSPEPYISTPVRTALPDPGTNSR